MYTGMAYGVPSSVSNFIVFCFEECQIDCLFAIQLKLHMIKIANQEFNFQRTNHLLLFNCLYFPLSKA